MWARSVLLAMALVAAGCASSGDESEQGDAQAQQTPDTLRQACADPTDCRLREVGGAAELQVGMAVAVGDPDEARIGAAEVSSVINHGFSWNVVEPERGTYNWGPADEVATYARDNDFDQIAMHLFWDQAGVDDAPSWLPSITDPDELRAVLRERALSVFSRYPDLHRVDVLNEPMEAGGGAPYDNHFRRVLGPDYAVELFDIAAAEAPPSTELFLNENLIEYLPAKAEGLVAFVEHLVAEGVRIDAVGLQTHLVAAGEPDWALYRNTMVRLEALGVDVFVSELDVAVLPDVPNRAAVQAERYRRVAEICLSVAACDELVIWGVTDRDSWLDWFIGPGTAPLLFDTDLQPKPAYEELRAALAAGRTNEPPAYTTTTTPTTADAATGTLLPATSARP